LRFSALISVRKFLAFCTNLQPPNACLLGKQNVAIMGSSDSKQAISDKQKNGPAEGQSREFSVEGQFKEDLCKDREAGYMSEEDGYEARCHSYIEGDMIDNATFSLSDDDELGSAYVSRDEAALSLLSHQMEAPDDSDTAQVTTADSCYKGESSAEEDTTLPSTVRKSLEQINASEVLCDDSLEKPFPVIASATTIRERFVLVELDVVTKDGMFVSRDDSTKRTDSTQVDFENVQSLQGTTKVCSNESVSKIQLSVSNAEECKQWREIPLTDKTITANDSMNEDTLGKNKANEFVSNLSADVVATDKNIVKKSDEGSIDRNTDERAIGKNLNVLDKNTSEESSNKNADDNVDKNTDEATILKNIDVIEKSNEEALSKDISENIIDKKTNDRTIDKNINVIGEGTSRNVGEIIIDKNVNKGAAGSNIGVVNDASNNLSDEALSKSGGEAFIGCNNDHGTVGNSADIANKSTSEATFSKNPGQSAIEKNTNTGIIDKNIGGKNVIDKNAVDGVIEKNTDQCAYSYDHDDIVIDNSIDESALTNNIGEVGICKNISENIIGSDASDNAIEKRINESDLSGKANDNVTSEVAARPIADEEAAEKDIVDKDTTEEVAFSKKTNGSIVDDSSSEETVSKNNDEDADSKTTDENIIQTNAKEHRVEKVISKNADRHVKNANEAATSKDTIVNVSCRNADKINVIDGSAKEDTVKVIADDNSVNNITSEENFSKRTEEGAIDKNICVILVDKNASKIAFCKDADASSVDKRTNETAVSKNINENIIGKKISDNFFDQYINKDDTGKNPNDTVADKNITEQTDSKNLDENVSDKNAEETISKTSNDDLFDININDATTGKNINEITIAKNANEIASSKNIDELVFDHDISEESVYRIANKDGTDKCVGERFIEKSEKTAEKNIVDRDTIEEAFSKSINNNIFDDSTNEGAIDKKNDESTASKSTGENILKTNNNEGFVSKSVNFASEEAISNTGNESIAHMNSNESTINGATVDIINGRGADKDGTYKNIKENVADKISNKTSVSKNAESDIIDRSSDKGAAEGDTSENITLKDGSEVPIRKSANDKIIGRCLDEGATGRNINQVIADKTSNESTVSKDTDDGIIGGSFDKSAAGRCTNENNAHDYISDKDIDHKNSNESSVCSEVPISRSTNDKVIGRNLDEDANSKNNNKNFIGDIANGAIGKSIYEAISDVKVSRSIGSMSMDKDCARRTSDESVKASEHCKLTRQCIAVEEILPAERISMCGLPENEQMCVNIEDQCKTVIENGSCDKYQDVSLSAGDESLFKLKSIDLSSGRVLDGKSKEALMESTSSVRAVELGKDLMIEGNICSSKDDKIGVCTEKECLRDSAAVADIGVALKESTGSKILLSFSKSESESESGLAAVNVAGNKEIEKCGSGTDSTKSCKDTPIIDENVVVDHRLSKSICSDSSFIIEGNEIHVVASGDQSADTPVTSVADLAKDGLPDSPTKLTIRLIEPPSAVNSGVGSDTALSGQALVEHTKKTMDQILKSGLADALLPTNLPDSHYTEEQSIDDNASLEKELIDTAKTVPTSSVSQTSKPEILSLSGSSIARDPVFKFISSLLENKNAKVVSSSSNSTVIVISPNDEDKGETRKEGEKQGLEKSKGKEAEPLKIEGGLSIVLNEQESSKLADIMAVKELERPNKDPATSVATEDSVAGHSPISNATALGANCNPVDKRKSSTKAYNTSRKRDGRGVVSSPKIPHKKKKESTHEETVDKQIEANIVCLPDKNLKVKYVSNSKSNSTVSILADNEGLSVSKAVAKRSVYRDSNRGSRRNDHGNVDEAKIDWLEKQFLSQTQSNNEKLKQYYDALKRSLLLKKKSHNITALEKETRGNILQSLKSLSVKNLALIRATQAIGEECTYKDVENVLKSMANCAQGDILSSRALNRSSAVVDDIVNGTINARKSSEKLREIVPPVYESHKVPASSTSTVFRSRNSNTKNKTVRTNLGAPKVVTIPSFAAEVDHPRCEAVTKLSTQSGGYASLLRDGPRLVKAQVTTHVNGSHVKQTVLAAMSGTSTNSKGVCSHSGTRGEHEIRHEKHNIDSYDKTSISTGHKLEAGERAQPSENEDVKNIKDGSEEVAGNAHGDEHIEKANLSSGNKWSASSSQASKLAESEKSFHVLNTVSETIVQSNNEKNDALAGDQKVKLYDKSSPEFKLVNQTKCYNATDELHSFTDAKERTEVLKQRKPEKDDIMGNTFEKRLAWKQSSKDMISNVGSNSDSLAKGIAKRLFVAEKKSILKSMFSKAKKEISTTVAESSREPLLQSLNKQTELKSFESNLMTRTVEASKEKVGISESKGSKVGNESKSQKPEVCATNDGCTPRVSSLGERIVGNVLRTRNSACAISDMSTTHRLDNTMAGKIEKSSLVKSQKSVVCATNDGCIPRVSTLGECIVGNVLGARNSAYVTSDMSTNHRLDNGMADKTEKSFQTIGKSGLIDYSVKDSRGIHPIVFMVQSNPVSESSMKLSDNITCHREPKGGNYMHGGLNKSPRSPPALRRLLPKSNALCVATLVEHLRKSDVKLALDGMMKLNQENTGYSSVLRPQFNLVYASPSASGPNNNEKKSSTSFQVLSNRKPMLEEGRVNTIQNSTSEDSDILAIREVRSLLKGLENPDTSDTMFRESKAGDTASNTNRKNRCVVESDLDQNKPAVASIEGAKGSYVDNRHGKRYSKALDNISGTRKRKLSSVSSVVKKEKFTYDKVNLHSFSVKQGKCLHKGEDGNAPSKSDDSILYLEMAIRSIASKNLHLGSSPQLVSRPSGISSSFLSTKKEALRDSHTKTSSRSSKLVAREAGAQGLKISRDLASLSWRNIRYNRKLIGRKRTLLDSTATQFSWECLHFFDGRKLRHDRPSIINKLQKHDIRMQRIGEHYGYLQQRTCSREESKESGKMLDKESAVEKETSPTSLRATASKCPAFSQPKEGAIEEKKCKADKLLSEKAKRLSEPVIEKSPPLYCKDETVKIKKVLLDLTKESEDRCGIDSSSARHLSKSCQTSVLSSRLRARPSRIPKDCACSNVVKSIKGTAFENSIGGLARSIIRQVRKRKYSGSEDNVCSKCNKVLESAKELTRHVLYHLIDKAVDCSFDDDIEERKAKRRKIMDFDLNRKEEESDAEKNKTASYDMVYVGTNESIEVQENSQVKEGQIYKAQFWTKERISCTTGNEESSHSPEANEGLSNDKKALWTPVYFDVPVKPLKWQCLKCCNKYNSIRELKLHADVCGRNVAEKEVEEIS